jgi:hypothetical protein
MERAEDVENVPMPGGIVITNRQVTRIEEAACLVLLMMGCIWILVVLGGAGDWKRSYRLAWFRLNSSLVFVQYKPIPRFQAFTKFNAFSCPRYQHLALSTGLLEWGRKHDLKSGEIC